jgi:release factor glutamine methyltransferase
MITTAKTLYENLYNRILPAAPSPGECRAIVLRIIEHFYNLDSISIALDKQLSKPLSTDVLQEVVEHLQKQEPIQYILQKSHFVTREFMVSPAVLIPRPETEELVLRILRENNLPHLHILDIATGSGCIAITLQKELQAAHVDAIDIDEHSLKVAHHNAEQHQVNITWHQLDILQDALPKHKWDIIVSNPPYVCMSEMQYMLPQVVAYEPAQALFVPDTSPLIFYERIIEQASESLTHRGKLYLEINEKFGKEVSALCHQHNFSEVSVGKDIHNKDRFVIATRSQ